MTTFNEKNHIIGLAEYNTAFWNVMRGDRYAVDKLHDVKDVTTGGFALPSGSNDKLSKAIKRESLFRNMATVVKSYNGSSRIFAKDCDDLAEWVPENGNIPIYDGVDDFIRYTVDAHKLAVFVKLDDDFVHDASFSIEDYLTGRLAKNFAKAEDYGFVTGTGDHMPTGILDESVGAQVGVTANAVTLENIISLYFSLDTVYRRNAVWLMNDETALALRLLEDENGSYLWNHTNDTILGKPVVISNDMPSAETVKCPSCSAISATTGSSSAAPSVFRR